MANRTASNQYLGEKPQSRRSGKSPSRSPARSPARSSATNGQKQQKAQAVLGYQSEGVQDHDIFSLPGSDWQLLGLLTLVAGVVRLFRIAQPSSVVFDEVQYVFQVSNRMSANVAPQASVGLRPSTSRASSSWTSTRRLQKCSSL